MWKCFCVLTTRDSTWFCQSQAHNPGQIPRDPLTFPGRWRRSPTLSNNKAASGLISLRPTSGNSTLRLCRFVFQLMSKEICPILFRARVFWVERIFRDMNDTKIDPELRSYIAPLNVEQRLVLARLFVRWARQLRKSVRAGKRPTTLFSRVPVEMFRLN